MGAVGSFVQVAVRFGSSKSAGRAIPIKEGSPTPTRLPTLLAGLPLGAAEAVVLEEDPDDGAAAGVLTEVLLRPSGGMDERHL